MIVIYVLVITWTSAVGDITVNVCNTRKLPRTQKIFNFKTSKEKAIIASLDVPKNIKYSRTHLLFEESMCFACV